VCPEYGMVIAGGFDIPDFGLVWWYWLPIIAIASILLTLLLLYFLFGKRDKSDNVLFNMLSAKVERQTADAMGMSAFDLEKYTEQYGVSNMDRFDEEQFEIDDEPQPGQAPAANTPYEVLKEILEKSNMYGETTVDFAEFNHAMGVLGVTDSDLVLDNVFGRIQDNRGQVSVDDLYDAIEEKIDEPSSREDIPTVLKNAILKTFNRERRASLSLLEKVEEAYRTAEENPRLASYGDTYDPRDRTASVSGLIKAETIRKLSPRQGSRKVSPHEFNATLVSMGVPFSEAGVLNRVLELEALQGDGIDITEFQQMLDEEVEANPDAAKSDAIINVLNDLIHRHGGKDPRQNAPRVDYGRQSSPNIFYEKWKEKRSVSRASSDREWESERSSDWTNTPRLAYTSTTLSPIVEKPNSNPR